MFIVYCKYVCVPALRLYGVFCVNVSEYRMYNVHGQISLTKRYFLTVKDLILYLSLSHIPLSPALIPLSLTSPELNQI